MEPTFTNDLVVLPGEHLLRLRDSLEELGARIAQLATALGLALEGDAVQTRLLTGDWQTAQPRGREARLHEQLRALLVMRYGLIARYARDISPGGAMALLVDAERTLEARGFRPGADGCTVDRMLNR